MNNIKLVNNFSIVLLALMLCTGLISSCSKDDIDDGGKTEQGETPESQAQATITLNNITATTATFTGHLNVDTSDVLTSQVTLFYSDSETLDVNTAESVTTTSFDSGQNFSFIINNLKMNTKYNYQIATRVNYEYTFGDIRSLTTKNIKFDEIVVTAQSFGAEISCITSGLSEADKKLIKVGIAYSPDQSKVKTEEGNKLDAIAISTNNSVKFTLSDLVHSTDYYYCAYAKQGNHYIYGNISKLTTLQHPYDIQNDLDLSSAKDLSQYFPANCYIIENKGKFKFKPYKGNSKEIINNVASASILWETFGTSTAPQCCELIKACCYKDGYIIFHTADEYKEGNAVIAAKDANGKILWSWHIWMTDEPQTQQYYNGAGVMMDRNLGATSNTISSVGALGLLYQWGRKDPFLGSSDIDSPVVAKSTITWPLCVESNSSIGTIEYATANPTTYISYNPYLNIHSWYYDKSSPTYYNLWTVSSSSKSIYDPCPAGWRVPDGGPDGVWAKAARAVQFEFPPNWANGINFKGKFYGYNTCWYPAAGGGGGNGGEKYKIGASIGYTGWYWAASSPEYDNDAIYCLNFSLMSGTNVHTADITSRIMAAIPIRCTKEYLNY